LLSLIDELPHRACQLFHAGDVPREKTDQALNHIFMVIDKTLFVNVFLDVIRQKACHSVQYLLRYAGGFCSK